MMQKISISVFLAVLILFEGCSTRGVTRTTHHSSAHTATETPKKQNKYTHPTMRPYVVRGVKYYPTIVSVGDEFDGIASWYGPDFHGKVTSSGETYDMHEKTAAHKTLPMNTIVKVTNKTNGATTVVRINDRGPFVGTRIIDLSNAAAKEIRMIGAGTAPVHLEIIGFAQKGKKNIPTTSELQASQTTQESDHFALQIGSFSKIEGAMYTQSKFDKVDGYRCIIKDIQSEQGRIFKVWLTGFHSEQEARDYKELGKFENAFIVTED